MDNSNSNTSSSLSTATSLSSTSTVTDNSMYEPGTEYFESYYKLIGEEIEQYEQTSGTKMASSRSQNLQYEIFEKAVLGIINLFEDDECCGGYYFVRVDSTKSKRSAMVLLQADESADEAHRRFKQIVEQYKKNNLWQDVYEYFQTDKLPHVAQQEHNAIQRIIAFGGKLREKLTEGQSNKTPQNTTTTTTR